MSLLEGGMCLVLQREKEGEVERDKVSCHFLFSFQDVAISS